MKKIFTFVLGAFMALSASASTIFVEFNEDQVTFEKGYNEVFDWDSESFINEYFWDFQGHIDGCYDVRVFYSSKVEELEGTYDVGDLQSLTELKDLHQNRTIWFESGTVTITKGEGDDDKIYVKCEIVGRDADDYTTQDYVINLTYSPKAAEGLPGDEDSDFLMNFESYTIDDELADEGMVYVEALDENRNYVVLEVSLPENATQLVAGTYEVAVVEDEDYPYQSVTAGSYQYGEPQASFASVLAEDGETIEKVWYIVSGKVFVKENMDIAIAANNSLGKRIAVVLHANSQAVEMTGVATKAIKTIENGMIVIEHNGVRRNVIGQIIR